MNDIVKDKMISVAAESIDDMQMEALQRELRRYRDIELAYIQLQKDHEALQSDHDRTKKQYRHDQTKFERLTEQEADLARREKELFDKEVNNRVETQLLELRRENAELRVDDHKKMFEVVFRNTTVRERIHSYGTQAVGGVNPEWEDQYGTRHGGNIVSGTENVNEHKDIDRTEE